jgi:hypothetical protein
MDSAIIVALIGGIFTLLGTWLNYHLTSRSNRALISQPSPGSQPQAWPPSTVSPPQYQTPARSTPSIRIGAVVRDAGMILVFTAIAGFLIGIGAGTDDIGRLILLIALFNILALIVGFTISAALIDGERWQHIGAVAVGVWLFGLVNVFVEYVDILTWLSSALIIAICAAVGGLLSYIFKRP